MANLNVMFLLWLKLSATHILLPQQFYLNVIERKYKRQILLPDPIILASAPYHIRRLGWWMEAMCYVCSRLQQLFEVSPWGMQLDTVPLCVVMGDVSTIRIPQPPPCPHYLHVSTYTTLNNAQGHRSGDTNINRIFSIGRRIHPYPLQQLCSFLGIIFDSLVYWFWFTPIVCVGVLMFTLIIIHSLNHFMAVYFEILRTGSP